MIISASRRTDIPGYYMPWFMNRIKDGYAVMQNPMNAGQYFRIPLTSDVVDCIVFWTKDPLPAIKWLPALEEMGYPFYFQFTLTPYGKALEKNLRPKMEIEDTFLKLSGMIGKEKIVWRYDPVILKDELTVSWHKKEFLRMCQRLEGAADTVTISFVDLYPKLRTKALRAISKDEMGEIGAFMGETAKRFGMRAVACCEGMDLTAYGIEKAACIDQRKIEKIFGCSLNIPKDRNQRANCGCCQSVDIWAYNTCLNGCVYCYANTGDAAAAIRYDLHDPMGEMLCGKVPDGIVLLERIWIPGKRGN